MFGDLEFETKLVSGNNGFSETNIIDPQEVDRLFLFLLGQRFESEHSSRLGHCLHDQDPWHDGTAWKMTWEEGFVTSDILYPDNPFSWFHLNNSVHEQERVGVGEGIHDLFNLNHLLLLLSRRE